MRITKHTTAVIIIAMSSVVALSGCSSFNTSSKAKANQKVSSSRLPTINVDRVTHTVMYENNKLSTTEQTALVAFLNSVGPGFSDRLTLEDSNPENSQARIDAVAKILGRLGVQLAGIRRAVDVTPGTSRLVLSRASVNSDECPDHTGEIKNNFKNATSSNFGCATRDTLARMVADPTDLIEGRPLGGQNAAVVAKPVASFNSHLLTGTPSGNALNWTGDGPAPK
jgi:pilus assembly protein CpaD